jgi:uncharacterized peroxidase-related enzyme
VFCFFATPALGHPNKLPAQRDEKLLPSGPSRWGSPASEIGFAGVSPGDAGGDAMSWVPLVTDEQASPEVKRLYDYIREKWGFVPNYFFALGRDAHLLEDQTNLFTNALFEERGLSRVLKEQVALVVSGLNMSSYCLAAHMEILGRMGIEKPMSRKLALDYASAPVEPKVMELFKFADKLTRHPGDMEKTDVERLRAAGWNDAAIVDTVLIASLYACANRFSAGLGLLPDF